jgi:hypothetical protein
MARTKAQGNGRLDELMATVLQGQAMMQQNIAAVQQNITAIQQNTAILQQNLLTMEADRRAFQKESAEIQRSIDQRFARIEALLLEHHRMLEALPDAVRDKIGFRQPQGSAEPTPKPPSA